MSFLDNPLYPTSAQHMGNGIPPLPEGVNCNAFSDVQCRELFQRVQGVSDGVN